MFKKGSPFGNFRFCFSLPLRCCHAARRRQRGLYLPAAISCNCPKRQVVLPPPQLPQSCGHQHRRRSHLACLPPRSRRREAVAAARLEGRQVGARTNVVAISAATAAPLPPLLPAHSSAGALTRALEPALAAGALCLGHQRCRQCCPISLEVARQRDVDDRRVGDHHRLNLEGLAKVVP